MGMRFADGIGSPIKDSKTRQSTGCLLRSNTGPENVWFEEYRIYSRGADAWRKDTEIKVIDWGFGSYSLHSDFLL